MSEQVETNAPELSMIEQLNQQLNQFKAQRDQAQTNLNQLIGAIFACEMILKKHEEDAAKQASKGVEDNGNTVNKEQEQTT